MRFAYMYFMKDDPDRIRNTVARHVAHWHQQRLPGYLGGPFEDRSGGLITFEAEDDERARRAVDSDPFRQEEVLKAYWLKRWTPMRSTQVSSPRRLAWPSKAMVGA